MMTVKELIRALEKMPQDAKVLVHVKELGGFQRVEEIKTMDGKGFGRKEFGEIVVVLDEKPFVSKKEQPQPQEEELENLCPECSMYCEERFTDGICK